MTKRLFLAQRISALLLVPLVIIHLELIIIAVRNGLSAVEILERTRGSVVWAMFYGIFVIAAAVHAPIGVYNILKEWTLLNDRTVGFVAVSIAVLLLTLGLRAVVAVTTG